MDEVVPKPLPFNPELISKNVPVSDQKLVSNHLQQRIPITSDAGYYEHKEAISRSYIGDLSCQTDEETCTSSEKGMKNENINFEKDGLAVIVAKIARKISPVSNKQRKFFGGWTIYDAYIYARYKKIWTKPRIILSMIVLLSLCFIFVVFIGASLEKKSYESQKYLSSLYDTSTVCVLKLGDLKERYIAQVSFQTRSNTDQDWKEERVAHCGSCGKCSTETDLQIYHSTAFTLKKDIMQCSMKGLYGGSKLVSSCIKDRTKFSHDCGGCWTERAMCGLNNCYFSCMKTAFFSRGGLFSDLDSDKSSSDIDDRSDRTLNSCLTCTEAMCDREFLQCAGANRRRSGIITDITRDNSQVCDYIN